MSGSVKIEGFSYCYPDGTCALQGIDFAIEEGQKVALIGSNGAGKSTLLRAMAGFIRGNGVITIDGLELCSQNLRQIRSVLGCFIGNPDEYLTMPTVYEDIIYGPLCQNLEVQQVRRNVDFALQKMAVTPIINKAPYRLSEGQKRSAAIASILSTTPKILLLDEPSVGLDPFSYENLAQMIRGLEQTIVFATCDMHLAREAADRVIVLAGGRVAADGQPSDILQDGKLLTANHLE